MSEALKKRMEQLKKDGKLTDFQHTQLLCLNTIMDSLVSIADSLKTINYGLSKIFHKEGKKGSPQVRVIDENEEED